MAVKDFFSRNAGIIGAVAAVGLAAGGVAAGVAADRYVRRRRTAADDPHAQEPFGALQSDEQYGVTTSDGVDLYVEVIDGPGPTLLFVHGFCLDMGTFHFQRRAFEGVYREVLYDQPGHGRSGRLPKGEYTLDALGAGLRAVLDKAAPSGKVVLVGHSMGGMTIMALAEQSPELFEDRVAGVVLISSSAGRINEVTFGLPAVFSRFSKPLLPVVRSAGRLTTSMADAARRASSDLAWLLTRRYGFGTEKPSPAVVSYVEKMNSTTSTEVIARYVHTLYTHSRVPALAALRSVPVLVVCGDTDLLLPLAYSEEIVRELPDAELVVVEGGGHVALLEHPAAVNDAMKAFLERIT
ncbi:alpha/beta hydrolase [Virgisporangium aliadipatigenens]|uniref:Alpha/beta hydrolase n=1 Tax=Virgisporangium aliadipatigenens TaxID=741659 RepID=A0A8J4DPJ6_9ACTN|nr:alpha/beta hydrolase [Virgisporangium aliadipatigenens]GIJ44728.1 alpha/beta hydrolase [Virgisporangium aliadipatigenens]